MNVVNAFYMLVLECANVVVCAQLFEICVIPHIVKYNTALCAQPYFSASTVCE